jgi:choline dehydrogenase
MRNVLLAKGVGGCGIHNAMLYVRCTENDIIKWNVSNWKWKDVLSTYISFEDYKVTDDKVSYHGYHSKSDDLAITTDRPAYKDTLSSKFIDSCIAHGMTFTNDFNIPHHRKNVAGYYDFNIAGGIRDSAATVMLSDLIAKGTTNTASSFSSSTIKNKPLFKLMTNSEVTRIILEPVKTMRNGVEFTEYVASGVEYKTGVSGNRVTKKILLAPSKNPNKANEIILTAGALLTPRILLNSGVGPLNVLHDSNITCLVNSPQVGKNIQDHPVIHLIMKIKDEYYKCTFIKPE